MVKKNKVTNKFNENIMSIINAISMLITYIIIGLVLYFKNDFFGSVTRAIIIGFTVVGILGIITEGRKLNLSYKMKGLDNALIGTVILVMFYLMKSFINIKNYNEYAVFVYQIVLFIFMLTGIFVFCKGIIEMIYSVCLKSKDKGLGNAVSSVFIMIAQVLALIILCLQIFNIFF